jgi:AraC family transcriptional regulator
MSGREPSHGPDAALGENCYSFVMREAAAQRGKLPVGEPARPPASRVIAEGEGWQLDEFICRLGPEDRPFEERHETFAVAAVVEGSFQYRSEAGTALLYPGAFLLGNVGTCFECGHDHGAGDRCVSFKFSAALFEEVAASVTGSHRFRFSGAMLPASRALTAPAVAAEVKAQGTGGAAAEEFALSFLETVLATVAGTSGKGASPPPRDQRRISRVLRYIEERAAEPLDLGELADQACMSKYHFLRSFRRIVGVTPYHFLLDLRMRRAAVRLCTSKAPVASVAFDAGFGDLSTFNNRFRHVFGASPSAYRRAQGTP